MVRSAASRVSNHEATLCLRPSFETPRKVRGSSDMTPRKVRGSSDMKTGKITARR
jgi:hypothetical protein